MVTELGERDHAHLSAILAALFAYDGRLAAELMAENASERALEAGGSAVGPDLCRFLDGIDEIAVRLAPTSVDIDAAAGGGGDGCECWYLE